MLKMTGYVEPDSNIKDKSKILLDLANHYAKWRRVVVAITTAQLHSTSPEFRFCAGSNPARHMSEVCDSEDL